MADNRELKEETREEDRFFARRGWRTSMGFYLAVLCSSFGIINIWRFPYIVMQNGGGAFLYVYFFLASIIGSCFIMAELLIGKMAQQSPWLAMDRWAKDRIALMPASSIIRKTFYRFLRRFTDLTLVAGVFVCAYYTVISGWVLSYLVNFLFSQIWPENFTPTMTDASEDSFLSQFLYAFTHLAICYWSIHKGLKKGSDRGLERMAYVVVPVFLILIVFLCFQSLTLPNALDSIRFLLYPDFTQVTYASLSQAMGHMVLSLGLGLGTMTTFGSYLKTRDDVTASGSKIMTVSVVMSVLSVVLICPMVFGAPYAVFGPKLLFQTLPQLILKFPGGNYVLIGFYLTLYLSSVLVTIGLLESLVSNFSGRTGLPRLRGLNLGAVSIGALMIFPILASTLWKHFRWMGGASLLESADSILVNFILPVLALGVALSALFILPSKLLQREFGGLEIEQEISQFFPIWRTIILWVAPLFILLAFILRALFTFRS